MQDAKVFVTLLTPQQLVKKFPTVFNQGVGKLAGKYHICLKGDASVQHAPRSVPVVLRDWHTG